MTFWVNKRNIPSLRKLINLTTFKLSSSYKSFLSHCIFHIVLLDWQQYTLSWQKNYNGYLLRKGVSERVSTNIYILVIFFNKINVARSTISIITSTPCEFLIKSKWLSHLYCSLTSTGECKVYFKRHVIATTINKILHKRSLCLRLVVSSLIISDGKSHNTINAGIFNINFQMKSPIFPLNLWI